MYSNMKYYENICNCLRVIQQDINRKLKSANCWQRTSLSMKETENLIFSGVRLIFISFMNTRENTAFGVHSMK